MSLFLSEQICHIMMATIGEPQNSRTKYSSTYNQTLLYGHPLNTDTSLLRTVYFVPGERKPLHFHYKNSTRLIYMDTPLIRTLSMPLSVSVLSGFHRIPAIHSSPFPLPCQEQLGRKDYK